MNKLPLHEIHGELGANFIESGEWLLPNDYGDSAAEYEAVKSSVGLADLSNRGKLRISGKHHLKFLQGMLSNDVDKLEPGKGRYAVLLTVKGRMISDMSVYKSVDFLLMDLEPGLNIKVSELLTKYRLSYKADIDDLTADMGLFSINGPKSGELLFKVLGVQEKELELYDHFTQQLDGHEVHIVKVNRTLYEGYDIYTSSDSSLAIWGMLIEAGKQLGASPVGAQAMNTHRIEAGIPVYGIDMDESNIPIEAGLWSALDFEKGCYVGQEVVARIKWRGHVNWHLLGIVLEGSYVPSAGDQIFSGERKIGRVTSAVLSPGLKKPIALGYIRREFKEPGTNVSVKSTDVDEAPATVSDIPFSAAT